MTFINYPTQVSLATTFKVGALILAAFFSGCSSNNSGTVGTTSNDKKKSSSTRNFTLQFKGMVGDMALNCDDLYTDLGQNKAYQFGIGDVRFYVSNLQFLDVNGEVIPLTLNSNSFQLNHEQGSVSLIDFSNKESGYCEIVNEGTPRTNTTITGTTANSDIVSVSFDIGVPQAVMKSAIAATDVTTDAPPPLAEMYWSWASGYRHFVINFTAMDSTHTDIVENSVFHVGSRDCGGAGKALSDRETCGLLNTPKVRIDDFDPEVNTVIVDLAKILDKAQDPDFIKNGNFGVQCHTSTKESACLSLFPALGLDIETGAANEANNSVFGKE